MGKRNEVAAASDQFYLALSRTLNGDASLMAEIWSGHVTDTTMHPVGGREVGGFSWESWDRMARLATDGEVHLDDQLIHVLGDVAYELGIERGQFSVSGEPVKYEVRITNIYRRESGDWRIVHHHADFVPAILKAANFKRPCPCCGYLVYWGAAGGHESCPICAWNDDFVQLRFPRDDGGDNVVSLIQAQRNFVLYGAKDRDSISFARKPMSGEKKDPDWFLIPDEMIPEFPMLDDPSLEDEQDTTFPDRTIFYYWKEGFQAPKRR